MTRTAWDLTITITVDQDAADQLPAENDPDTGPITGIDVLLDALGRQLASRAILLACDGSICPLSAAGPLGLTASYNGLRLNRRMTDLLAALARHDNGPPRHDYLAAWEHDDG